MASPEHFYEKMKFQLQRQLPFVAWRKPGEDSVSMLFQEDDTVHRINDYSESGFVFARFQDEKKPVFIPAEHRIICHDDQNATGDPGGIVMQHSASGKAAHLQLVSKGIEAIGKGRFKKVVLSRKEEIPVVNPDATVFFRRLLKNYPGAFCYLWSHPATGLWLGATPETLLKFKGNRFETMALAGTQKFEGTASVSWGEKEREEQQMVADFITAKLQPLARQLKVSGPRTSRAGNLLHLRTDIEGVIQNSEFGIQNELPNTPSEIKKEKSKIHNAAFIIQHLIKALHPTPAVCGYPADAAKRFILEHERYDRAFYTGFLGELNGPSERQSSIYVNLRCMQIVNDRAVLYVGGGINKGSVPENEWRETVNKAQTMLKALGGGH